MKYCISVVIAIFSLTGCSRETKPRFDIPSLMGKDLNGVTQILGDDYQPKTEPAARTLDIWGRVWNGHGNTTIYGEPTITVRYRCSTGKVIFIQLSSDELNRETKDKDRLLKLGNLKEGDLNYRIEYTPSSQPGYVTTVRAIPNDSEYQSKQ